MDVLHEIFRSNGRQLAHMHHQRTEVGTERGRYFLRGASEKPFEVMTVFFTSEELERLIAFYQRQQLPVAERGLSASMFDALRGLALSAQPVKRE